MPILTSSVTFGMVMLSRPSIFQGQHVSDFRENDIGRVSPIPYCIPSVFFMCLCVDNRTPKYLLHKWSILSTPTHESKARTTADRL